MKNVQSEQSNIWTELHLFVVSLVASSFISNCWSHFLHISYTTDTTFHWIVMEEKDRDVEAMPGQSRIPREQSPTGSTSTEVDYDKITIPARNTRSPHPTKGTMRSGTFSEKYGDEVDHGEPDFEYEDAEDAVPGRELDRQLSRVGSPSSVSQVGTNCTAGLTWHPFFP